MPFSHSSITAPFWRFIVPLRRNAGPRTSFPWSPRSDGSLPFTVTPSSVSSPPSSMSKSISLGSATVLSFANPLFSVPLPDITIRFLPATTTGSITVTVFPLAISKNPSFGKLSACHCISSLMEVLQMTAPENVLLLSNVCLFSV